MKRPNRRAHRRLKPVEVSAADYTVDVALRRITVPSHGIDRRFPGIELLVGEANVHAALMAVSEYSLRYTSSTATGRLIVLSRLLKQITTAREQMNTSTSEIAIQTVDIMKELTTVVGAIVFKEIPTKAEFLKTLNSILGELTSCGLLAFTPFAIPPGSRRKSNPRPDLVKLNPELQTAPALPQANRDVSSYQMAIYVDSMERLRTVMEDVVLTAAKKFELGSKLIEQAPSKIIVDYQKALAFGRGSRQLFEEIFPSDNDDVALANLLKIYRDHYYIKPGGGTDGVIHLRLAQAVKRFGGAANVADHLTLSARTVTAIAALLLIERYVNPSLVLSLPTSYERPTDDRNMILVHGVKLRVGPEEIPLLLPLTDTHRKLTAATALRMLFRCNSWVRATYPQLTEALFAYISYFGPTTLSQEVFADHINEIGKSNGFTKVLPSSIRPTGGVIEIARGDMHTTSQRLQQAHGSSSTHGYLLGAETMLVARMREFQENLQIGIAATVPAALEKLGYSGEKALHAKEKAKRTGLGFFCRDEEKSRITSNGECQIVGHCASCHVKLFVADPLSIGEQIAIDEILTARMEKLYADDPERWESVWVNMLAFAKACVEKVKSSYFSRHLKEARQLARQLVDSGYDPTKLRS